MGMVLGILTTILGFAGGIIYLLNFSKVITVNDGFITLIELWIIFHLLFNFMMIIFMTVTSGQSLSAFFSFTGITMIIFPAVIGIILLLNLLHIYDFTVYIPIESLYAIGAVGSIIGELREILSVLTHLSQN